MWCGAEQCRGMYIAELVRVSWPPHTSYIMSVHLWRVGVGGEDRKGSKGNIPCVFLVHYSVFFSLCVCVGFRLLRGGRACLLVLIYLSFFYTANE